MTIPKVKASDIASIKIMLKDKADVTQAMLRTLSPEARKLWDTATFIAWAPLDHLTAVYDAAAAALFPGDPPADAMFKLGKAMAEISYGGIYKALLRLPTVGFLIKSAAQLFHTYYDRGEVSCENVTDKAADFLVRNFPELPLALRITTSAHLVVLTERTGAKNVAVKRIESNPQVWLFKLTWE